jgi:3-deoxy-manno-octulosonate cytidylyltransferase (CMP-KDO synthetase)
MSKTLNQVYVATCDSEIANYIESIGGKAVMTANTHERASDRTAEAMSKIEKQIGGKADVVVMIQGDEPMVYPEMIEESIKPMLNDSSINVVNLMATLKSKEEQNDPHEVKVVVDQNSFALYFSRESIPSWKKAATSVPMLKQVCIIPFKRDFLIKFNELNSTPLEIVESVDMLRVLEHGYKVKMVLTKFDTYSVDTIDDLKKVEKLMASDLLMNQYK